MSAAPNCSTSDVVHWRELVDGLPWVFFFAIVRDLFP